MEHNKRSNRLVKAKEYLQTIQDRFCKFQQDLVSKEDYIKYLKKEILIQDKELNPLRSEISNFIKQLEKVFKEAKNQENYIAYLEKQLVFFQNEIDKLNKKILILYKNSNVTIEMAQQPGSSRLSLPENQAMIQNNRIHIVDYLNIISDASNRFERLVLDIYPWVNTHAINAENQKRKCKTLKNDLLLANVQLDLKWANMATIQEVMAVVTSLIAPIPQYIGQESPEDYVNKIKQLYNYGSTVGVVANFNNALNTEYQRNNIGTQQIATQKLIQEKFTPYDTPETYETRIKPFLLGVPINDNYVLGQNFQTSSQPVIQPQLQKNIPPPLPSARQMGIGITPTPLSKLSPGEKIIHPKSEKAKALQEIMDYARLGLNIEDERSYDLMEIDLAIVNIARRIRGNITIPTTNIEEEVYKEIVYEDEDNENVKYVEVKDRPEEMLCNNSTVAMNLLRNILNEFKTLLSSYNLSPELASSMALDEPMDINLVYHPANDLTTAECKINNILIPKAVLDEARHLGLKIDTTNPPSLEGVATDASSYGWCYNVLITFTNRALTKDTDYTMIHDVIVSDYDKYALIIGTDWLDLAGGKVDYEKHKFRVGNTFVSILVHKSNIKEECINYFFQDICAYTPTPLLEYDLPSFSSNT
ncbi:23330_t:CDS:10 [Cetraspora pellucida]|uniref:23330_t:CDS:1 n=1 Tax=Cetraspora pellucida TaxID=1433469 RepID=A0A9N9ISC0_9GLOM|nr:23330_t:CDS:10 [Cetraspora pellucida]